MEPRFGEYVWPDRDSRPQIPPIFDEPFKLRTAKAAVFQGVLMVAFMVVAIIFKRKIITLDGQCSILTVLLFIQVSLWAISFIIHHYYSTNHTYLRNAGYNTFSEGFDQRSSFQFLILTCWNAITLLYVAASIEYAPSVICDLECSHSALNLTIYAILVLGGLFLVATFNYVRTVIIFNNMNPVPETVVAQIFRLSQDLLQEEQNDVMRRFVTEQSFQIDFYRNLLFQISQGRSQRELLQSQLAQSLIQSPSDEDGTGRRRSFLSIWDTI